MGGARGKRGRKGACGRGGGATAREHEGGRQSRGGWGTRGATGWVTCVTCSPEHWHVSPRASRALLSTGGCGVPAGLGGGHGPCGHAAPPRRARRVRTAAPSRIARSRSHGCRRRHCGGLVHRSLGAIGRRRLDQAAGRVILACAGGSRARTVQTYLARVKVAACRNQTSNTHQRPRLGLGGVMPMEIARGQQCAFLLVYSFLYTHNDT